MAGPKTLDEYVTRINSDFFNLRNTSNIEVYKDFEYINYNAIENYLPLLLQNSIEIKLSPEEQNKFKYRPKSLSKYIYGTENLHYLILYMNNLTTATFTPEKLIILSGANRDMIESIINLEKTIGTI